jgi:cytochrome P450
MRAYTARAIEGLREHIEKVAAELLDHMAAKGQGPTPVDLIADYAEILPVLVIAEILGVPMDMRPQFRIWATDIVAAADLGIGYTPFRRSEKASRAMHDWMLQHQRRLRLAPGEDLFSRMVAAAQAPDAAVDDHGLVVNATLLLFAGFETTVNLIGNGLELMDRHPDQLATLKADPARWANAVEEILRFAPPVQNTFRYPAEDLVLEGVPLAKGHLLGLVLAGANRDPEVFQDPDRFDVTRDNAREHLTFGGGPHFCLGAALARMEGTIAMRALYDRFPDLHPAAALRRRPSRTINGIAEFPAWLQA